MFRVVSAAAKCLCVVRREVVFQRTKCFLSNLLKWRRCDIIQEDKYQARNVLDPKGTLAFVVALRPLAKTSVIN